MRGARRRVLPLLAHAKGADRAAHPLAHGQVHGGDRRRRQRHPDDPRGARGHRHRGQGGQAGVDGGRLFAARVQPPAAARALARAQRLPALGAARAVRDPPRAHHRDDPGRLLLALLLRVDCSLQRLPDGGLRDHLHHRARLLARARRGRVAGCSRAHALRAVLFLSADPHRAHTPLCLLAPCCACRTSLRRMRSSSPSSTASCRSGATSRSRPSSSGRGRPSTRAA